MTPYYNEQQESAKQASKHGQRSFRKQEPAEQSEGNGSQGKPPHHGPVEFATVEPDTAGVSDELRDGENRDGFADAEDSHNRRQQNRRAAEAGHSA